jgi:Asp-tRNA(Asn)/Glu-tRNA(Gln) amidotransferase A subunit family amidase
MEELFWKSGRDLAEAIRKKAVSPVEVVKTFLSRIEEVNPKINAVVTLAAESALAGARAAEEKVMKQEVVGPLHGVPLLVKDNVHTKNIRTTFGSCLYKDYIPGEDAVLVERLKAAGAIVLGKTNLPEFAIIGITDNVLFGPTRNPWDLRKTSGGSSGGAVAAVAAGLSPLATGNDAGGSIRSPAALCGVYGLKPSFGRVPCYPRFLGWETMNHEGPITRTVEDAALMMDVMSGPDDRDRFSLPDGNVNFLEAARSKVKPMRIAYSPDLGYVVTDPEVRRIIAGAVRVFEQLGCVVEEIDVDIPNMEEALQMTTIVEVATAHEEHLEQWLEVIYPGYVPFLSFADSFSGKDIVRYQFSREALWHKIRPIFDRYDILLTPTTAVAAFDYEPGGPIGPMEIDGKSVGPVAWSGFLYPFNFTGQPAASVPCGFTAAGLPVGLQIVGKRHDDAAVLSASAAFEEACPWVQHRPLPA